jgi:hypothetical protein
MTKALKEFLKSLHRNAHAVKLVEPKLIAEKRMAQKIAKLEQETEAQRETRIFNEWENVLNG